MSAAAPVLVVGAGPAGCAASLVLARGGHEVHLIERAQPGRDKVCGDVLLPEAQSQLERMGIDTAPLIKNAHRVTGCAYHTPLGRRVELPFVDRDRRHRDWWVLARRQLDQMILEQVTRAGVVLHSRLRGIELWVHEGRVQGVVVQGACGPPQLRRARAVIAADGASSAMARGLGRFERHRAHLCVALRAYVNTAAGDDRLFSVFTSHSSLPGCGWIVPLGQGRANVGVGAIVGELKRRGLNVHDLIKDVAAQHPAFARACAGLPRLRGWSLPGATWSMPRVAPGVLFVGDAGNLVDPFTGHGIHVALDSGRIAGEVLGEAIDVGDLSQSRLSEYEQRVEARWGHEARLGYALQRATSRAWAVERGMAHIDASKLRREMCGGLVGHCGPRAEMLRALIWAMIRGRSRSLPRPELGPEMVA